MSEVQTLPVVPLRKAVLFPGPTVSLTVGRQAIRVIEGASRNDGRIFVVAQRADVDSPSVEQLHAFGVVARVGQIQQGLGGVQVAVSGLERAVVLEYHALGDGAFSAAVRRVDPLEPVDPLDPSFLALHREVRERALELAKLRGLAEEVVQQVLEAVLQPGQFADLVAAYLEIPVDEKQVLLETLGVEERLRRVLVHLQRQLDLAKTQQQIRSQVQEELGERQREMYLREQMRAIQKELGQDQPGRELDDLRKKLDSLDLPTPVRDEALRELGRLERSGRDSVEGQVIRTYLQWITELPWNTVTDDQLDVEHASWVLESDHYGLSDVKDRILEFLSLRQLAANRARESKSDVEVGVQPVEAGVRRAEKARTTARGPILLFTGPPGVGKTSIAKSIARALGRKYVRISLGGVRDEADIRGHRRTYVGALPGRIVQGLKQAGSKNPVFLLDEVDKLGISMQGDPASALLEVLDPAQNDTFTDHYLGVPFDLSEVLFIATANVTHTIPSPLLDRMETVEFAGYTEREKAEIARRYLVPQQLGQAMLSGRVELSGEAVDTIITRYTRESGVRQLDREIGAVVRKLARRVAAGGELPAVVGATLVRELLGRPRVRSERAVEEDEVGVATGMYYTPAGGDIMFVEAAVRRVPEPGRSNGGGDAAFGSVSLILTGQLGEVMQESARAALTYATTHAEALHIPGERLGSIEAHIHVPAGAVPKDGPSAGVTIATALASAMSGRAVHGDVALTGEITLSGRVLPIGGVKEKVLGAHRAGIHRVVLPIENRADLEDVPSDVRADLEFHFAGTLDQVLDVALVQ